MSIAASLPASGSRVWFARLFLWLVIVQGFHFLEHNIQLVQRYVFDDPQGNGLLGNLAGFEQLHFGYNTLFLLGLSWLYTEVSLAARASWSRHGLVVGLLAAALAVQGYHEVEHVLRMGQVLGWLPVSAAAVSLGSEPPGLIGQRLPGAAVHWALNGIVEALPVSAFVLGRFHLLLNPVSSGRRR